MDTKTKIEFYDKLAFIYIEMPKFRKTEGGQGTRFEEWLFILNNLTTFNEIPEQYKTDPVFSTLFYVAEVANLNEEDMKTYQASLKEKWDWQSSIETAMKEGIKKGIEKEKREVAKKLKKENMPVEKIAEVTGLSIDEIRKL